jgi:hypothetical protein
MQAHFGNGAAVEGPWRKPGKGKNAPKPRLTYASDVTFDPTVTDPIKHVIGRGETGMLFGPSSAGKTFVAFDLEMAIATGRTRWCGRLVKQGPVLHVAFEGGRGAGKRLLAAVREHGDPGAMLAILDNAPPLNKGSENAGVEMIIAAADGLAMNAGMRVSLIVIDTLSAAAAGDDENSAGEMSAVVAKLKMIAERTGAAVLAIHHTGKDRQNGMRGSSALRGNADFVIELTEAREMTIEKCREGRTGSLARFELKEVELGVDDDGERQTSCVIRFLDGVAMPARKPKAPLSNQAHLALEVLQSLYNDGKARHVPKDQINDVEVPRCVRLDEWRQACRTRGLTKESEADPKKKAEAEKKAFQRAADTIERAHLIGSHAGEVWLLGQQAAKRTAPEVAPWAT